METIMKETIKLLVTVNIEYTTKKERVTIIAAAKQGVTSVSESSFFTSYKTSKKVLLIKKDTENEN
jgi:hypothetical protein